MPPPIPFAEFARRFEAAAQGRGARLGRLPNRAPYAWLIGDGATAASPALALLSGLHGDETSGPLMLLDWLETAPRPLLPPGVRVWLLPLVNDLGWDAEAREWNGYDLNRSFLPGRQAAPILAPVMRSWRRRPPSLLLDFHEDGYDPPSSYIFRYTLEQHDLPDRLAADLDTHLVDWTDFTEWQGCSEIYLRSLGVTRCVTSEAHGDWPLEQRIAWNRRLLDWALAELARLAG